jgi:hypothetical protein
MPEEEAAVFAAVTTDESPVDRIIERCGLPAHVVSGTLMKLEMRNSVRAFPGFRYARRSAGKNRRSKPVSGIFDCTHDRVVRELRDGVIGELNI